MQTRKMLAAAVSLLIVSVAFAALWIFTRPDDDPENKPDRVPTRERTLPPLVMGQTPEAVQQVDGLSFTLVHPSPNSVLSVADYNRGVQINDWAEPRVYDICIFTDISQSSSDIICNLPPQLIVPNGIATPTAAPSLAPSLDPTCVARAAWRHLDFFAYITIYLDGEQVSQMDTLHWDVPGSFHLLCFNAPLEPGIHTMRYVFDFPPDNAHDEAEWSFTLTP
jgi:hypothetical protein